MHVSRSHAAQEEIRSLRINDANEIGATWKRISYRKASHRGGADICYIYKCATDLRENDSETVHVYFRVSKRAQ